MNEAQLTQKFVRELRQDHPSWVIWKHNDRLSSGIPDLSITRNGRTVWLEVKKEGGKFQKVQQYWLTEMVGYYLILPKGAVYDSSMRLMSVNAGDFIWDLLHLDDRLVSTHGQ
jgi:hypothetical protein